jgi:tetratricopeptide (TPR) repeat protein
LDKLIEREPKHLEAWTLRGHAYFLNGNLFESEESYIRALRLKPGLKDQVLQERLGLVYLKRKSWKDASVVFLKCCKQGQNDFLPSTTAWISLGISQLRLGEYLLAEEAFTQANILDHLNPRPWGLLTVLCLQTA